MSHRTAAELDAALDTIRASPSDRGTLELIVRRPAVGGREVLDEGELDSHVGLVGDSWHLRETSEGVEVPDPDTQITVMNARAIAAIAGERARWPLAGDQLYVDLDLGAENLPPGSRLAIGAAVIEVTAEPHTGCGQFRARYGADATRFVNSPTGRRLHLRGINAKVVVPGRIRVGDTVTKLPSAAGTGADLQFVNP